MTYWSPHPGMTEDALTKNASRRGDGAGSAATVAGHQASRPLSGLPSFWN
jgi:hypothetical protein